MNLRCAPIPVAAGRDSESVWRVGGRQRGQVYLDCLAGAGTLVLGYNHPEINQALIEQLNAGIPYQTLDITRPRKTTLFVS
nr:hypothetical protein [Enterovibrio nigricans]